MIDKSILIAALARDCNDSVVRNIPKIELLRKEFRESHVVIIENDSKDGTKDTLRKWKEESEGVEAIMNNFGTVTIPEKSDRVSDPGSSGHRISKMARYRNMYMDYARNASFEFDYLVVMDIDIDDFSVEGIIKCIKNAPDGWGGLFANGRQWYNRFLSKYYDMFAYVPYGSENYDLTFKDMIEGVRSLLEKMKKNNYVECDSAFGGIGIYRWEAVSESVYKTEKNRKSKWFDMICEHILFNRDVKNCGYRNYICRDMKVWYGKCPLNECIAFSVLPAKLLFAIYKMLNKKIDGLNI